MLILSKNFIIIVDSWLCISYVYLGKMIFIVNVYIKIYIVIFVILIENFKLFVMLFGLKGDEIVFNGDSYSFECKFIWILYI